MAQERHLAVVANTPHYVLMDGNRRIGPKVARLHSGIECAPIYGFSGKGPYDKFLMNSQLVLTPYPLVTVYVRDQAGAPGDALQLVVVDAAGPREPCVYAATMEAVLEAQENRTTHVTAGYQLTFDRQANTYLVEEASA
jgi:hypothetical protein